MQPHPWKDVPREQMNDLVVRQVIHGANTTVARLEMKRGAMVAQHHHLNEQMTVMISGRLRFVFPERTLEVAGGEVMEIEPNLPHSVEALEDSVAIDVFSPRREDWLRGDDAYLRGR